MGLQYTGKETNSVTYSNFSQPGRCEEHFNDITVSDLIKNLKTAYAGR